jgi:hypothetical protein
MRCIYAYGNVVIQQGIPEVFTDTLYTRETDVQNYSEKWLYDRDQTIMDQRS